MNVLNVLPVETGSYPNSDNYQPGMGRQRGQACGLAARDRLHDIACLCVPVVGSTLAGVIVRFLVVQCGAVAGHPAARVCNHDHVRKSRVDTHYDHVPFFSTHALRSMQVARARTFGHQGRVFMHERRDRDPVRGDPVTEFRIILGCIIYSCPTYVEEGCLSSQTQVSHNFWPWLYGGTLKKHPRHAMNVQTTPEIHGSRRI
jgi:hypothetical protein